MKKLLMVMAGGIIISLTITSSANAQQGAASELPQKDSMIYAKNDKPRGSMFDVTPVSSSNKLVSKKAIRKFGSGFSKAENVQWFALKDGYIAYCNVNGHATRVYYDKAGNHRFTTRSYDEKQLPTDVRAQVKRTYYDFSIYNVLQVDTDERVVYMVYIKDEKSFKTIRVSDGEMDEYETHNYQR